MNIENTKYLFDTYPQLFPKNKSMEESLMCFGFECGDGWFNIIENLCDDILEICKITKCDPPEVTQVKEKMGGLRFYITGMKDNSTFDAIDDLIESAVTKSYTICEICGRRGTTTDIGWIQTLCKEHKKKKGVCKLK